MYWQLSDISFDIHVLYFIVLFLMSMFVLAAKLLFIDSYYFLLVQLLNDLYQQSLFVCSCSKRAEGSAIKHQQGIKTVYSQLTPRAQAATKINYTRHPADSTQDTQQTLHKTPSRLYKRHPADSTQDTQQTLHKTPSRRYIRNPAYST